MGVLREISPLAWDPIPIPASVCFSLGTKKFEIEKRTVYLSTENHYIEQV